MKKIKLMVLAVDGSLMVFQDVIGRQPTLDGEVGKYTDPTGSIMRCDNHEIRKGLNGSTVIVKHLGSVESEPAEKA